MKNKTTNTRNFTNSKIQNYRLHCVAFIALFMIISFLTAACENPSPDSNPENDSKNNPNLSTLTGTITITTENGLTTGTELSAVYTGTETISYQWNMNGNAIPTAVSNKYIPPIAGSYTVTVNATGYNSKTSSAVIITGEALPALTGTVYLYYYEPLEVGQTLQVLYIIDLSPNNYGTFSYQWNRSGTPISGANNSSYTVQVADVGSTITVTLTCSGYSGSLTSSPTATVPPPPPTLTGTVTIIGTGLVRETLTVDTNNLGGNGTINYQWLRTHSSYDDSYIGINNNVYVVQSSDIGSTITVIVTRSGNSGSITSEPVGPVIDPNLPALSGTVNITGIAEIGQTLTANTDSLGGTGDIFYYWKRGTTDVGINNRSYFVPFSDADSTITVTVYRSGNSGSITSETVQVTIGESLLSTPGLAFTLKNDGTSYSVSKGTAIANEVIIPFFHNGLPVTEIPEQGFVGSTNMTSIRIPSIVKSIGRNAFYGCSKLISITIPFVGGSDNNGWYNYTHFGYIFGASYYDNQNSYIPPSLKTVVITGGTSIKEGAFYSCNDLTSITIPSSVTNIGYYAFSGCSSLTSVTFQGIITSNNFSSYAFDNLYNEGYIGDLRNKYLAGGIGTYTRPDTTSLTWTKE